MSNVLYLSEDMTVVGFEKDSGSMSQPDEAKYVVYVDDDTVQQLEAGDDTTHEELETQFDPATYTVSVDEDMYQMLDEHHDLEDISGMNIWDDTSRPEDEMQNNAEQGFIAEAALVYLLERFGIDCEWGGGKGEADLKVFGQEIDVKSRASRGEYSSDKGYGFRNLLKDYKMGNTDKNGEDTVDQYVHTVVHYSPFDPEDEVVAVEFVGFISNEQANKKGNHRDDGIYGNVEGESEKLEVHPFHLTQITDLRFHTCDRHYSDSVSESKEAVNDVECDYDGCSRDATRTCYNFGKQFQDTVSLTRAYETNYGKKVGIDSPYKAKDVIKDLDWNRVHQSWDGDKNEWLVDEDSLDYVIEHLEDNDWRVIPAEKRVCENHLPDTTEDAEETTGVCQEPRCPLNADYKYETFNP